MESKLPRHFYHPKYWPVWLLIGAMWGLVRLPWPFQKWVAKGLGFLLYNLAGKRRNIVRKNLQMCFPEWNEEEQQKRVKDVFYHNALGMVEAFNAFNHPSEKFHSKVDIHGTELLEQAKAKGKGVILIGAHYSHLDFGAALISLVTDATVIYRPNNNPVMDHFILKGRQKILKDVIPRDNMRAVIRALKNDEVVWYPPDQDYGEKHSVYVPFFGVNAATITATSRLVKFNDSPVLMLSYRRDDNSDRYTMEFEAPPEGFPSGDDAKDAELINQALERNIRKAPTQYMWTHRRFKTQPDGKGNLYRS
ncbi:LpxL/LpxP family Kdo(2)-lipid IV(A) lauroyl/palmitoleoyl acyltransferase [Pseudoteredinibacter isoporae]|uniref:Lipid A biosynthesis acyltransferase n=1 Tax=Pseudoteredinibacter isoporae TaxID=570281 RepID=A0A7X0JTA2_9GAMM|nr:LpxL/LpxP family Kdo(2)-lipid IV(A) lauroyl/palmitoleoyl acyltransferase [Pseudoteredinibacter isoporae]MBB6521035.1 KDO2-lipid IV(A) lauroyltransferase [Pseudoteredinibacter isoporae]NHO86599.1 LpxL/LpxP family Kdo(2)-lipid IV(A) lauroyl/palmitoleoyl acyltransferase [Pseudoteredinibacter isoporae]NIB24949.1 LpxL/LpxP family Kdo(2)-lipid IV(A) lauroyl/palmitoleoyl acyltransferase [Pseudoteredinibacter isoporae]